MSSSPIEFESSRQKSADRQRIRAAREVVLAQAEHKAGLEAARREKERSWMLPDLDAQLTEDHGRKQKKSKKEKKKRKKEKKEKRKRKASSSSDSEQEWVEKKPNSSNSAASDWLTFDSLLSQNVYDRSDLSRKSDAKKAEKEALERVRLEKLQARELNPNLRGDLAAPSTSASSSSMSGDGGLSWLQRAFKRAQEQAKREGKSIEEVAASRWGSLEKFNAMLAKASNQGSSAPLRHGPSRHGVPKDGGWKTQARLERDKAALAEEHQLAATTSQPDPTEPEPTPTEPSVAVELLSEQQLNALGAKIIKAEMMGNSSLVQRLKAQLSAAKAAQEQHRSLPKQEEVVLLTLTNSKGLSRPVESNPERRGRENKRGSKAGQVATHEGKDRVRYFADDDGYTLKQMFQREKLATSEEENALFSRLAGKGMETTSQEYAMDDVLMARASKMSGTVDNDRDKAIDEHKRMVRKLDGCRLCLGTELHEKHLMVAMGKWCYLTLPGHTSLSQGHCWIVPLSHTPCALQMDEDVFSEVQDFRRALTHMFLTELDMDCVFFETAMHLKSFPHMLIECVPLPKEQGELAPMFFQKAIQESESEWAHNKKLISLKDKGLHRSLPKGLPYFHVDFGMESGFAHVIEDEQMFERNFAYEILGGLLELETRVWRKPRREGFEQQRKKVIEFGSIWKAHDFTKRARPVESSSSSSG